MSILRPALAAAFLALCGLPAVAHDGVHVDDAYARFIPGARSGAGYMLIENHATVDEKLLSISSDVAGMVEIHESVTNADGTMGMSKVEGGLAIPAQTTVALKPGGAHLMFMMLKTRPKDGDTIHLMLTFEHAGKVDVDIPVNGKR